VKYSCASHSESVSARTYNLVAGALVPTTAARPDARIVLVSSPWGSEGYFYRRPLLAWTPTTPLYVPSAGPLRTVHGSRSWSSSTPCDPAAAALQGRVPGRVRPFSFLAAGSPPRCAHEGSAPSDCHLDNLAGLRALLRLTGANAAMAVLRWVLDDERVPSAFSSEQQSRAELWRRWGQHRGGAERIPRRG
jgi:hypothetical protein